MYEKYGFPTPQTTITERRRVRVAEMYLKGRKLGEICFLIGICRRTLKDDLTAIREEWKDARVGFMERAVAEQLEKLDQVEAEAWEQWERSKQPAKVTMQTESPNGKVTVKIERREQCGDPRYLAIITDCGEQRCKLLGVNAPLKTESTINATITHYVPPPTRAELAEQLAASISKLRERNSVPSNN